MFVGWFQLDDEPNLEMNSGGFTKHPFKTGGLGFQAVIFRDHFIIDDIKVPEPEPIRMTHGFMS